MTEHSAIKQFYPSFIGSKDVPAASGETIDVLCPSDGRAFATIARGRDVDIDLAVKTARKAFDEGPWPRLSATDRGRVLMKMSELILRDREKLATLEAMDVGKLYKSAFSDVTVLARYFEF